MEWIMKEIPRIIIETSVNEHFYDFMCGYVL